MTSILLLSNASASFGEVLPALELLAHEVRALPARADALERSPAADLIMIDARQDLAGARTLCRSARTAGLQTPIILVLTEGGLAAVSPLWLADDVVLESAGPAEVEARLRLRVAETGTLPNQQSSEIRAGGVLINEAGYTARLHGQPLNLTYREFELLKHLALHPGLVFSRDQLLHEVWGYDYYGGARTVDVHIRRLRAKLGAENEQLIGTVRNVGYRFALDAPRRTANGSTSRPTGDRLDA